MAKKKKKRRAPTGPRNPYFENALQSMQRASEEAKSANLSRYSDILGKYQGAAGEAQQKLGQLPQMYQDLVGFYGDRTAGARADLESMGRERSRQLGDTYKQAQDALLARGGGLASTFYGGEMERLARSQARQQEALGESLAGTRLGILGQYTGQEGAARAALPQALGSTALQQYQLAERPLQFQERRTDTGPTLGQAAQLGSMLGVGEAAPVDYTKFPKQPFPSNVRLPKFR